MKTLRDSMVCALVLIPLACGDSEGGSSGDDDGTGDTTSGGDGGGDLADDGGDSATSGPSDSGPDDSGDDTTAGTSDDGSATGTDSTGGTAGTGTDTTGASTGTDSSGTGTDTTGADSSTTGGASCEDSCDGCCVNNSCMSGDADLNCGMGGDACIACETYEECVSASCDLDATANWTLTADSATILNGPYDFGSPSSCGGTVADPYVTVVMGGSNGTSDPVEQTYDAVWNDILFTDNAGSFEGTMMTITVYDDDGGGSCSPEDLIDQCSHQVDEAELRAGGFTISFCGTNVQDLAFSLDPA